MAPRPISTIILLSFVAAASAATVTIEIPFGPQGVPSVNNAPLLAGFKDKVLKAFADGLSYIVTNPLPNSGLSAPAPDVTLVPVPIWTFDTSTSPQTATVVFPYPDLWLPALTFFVAHPEYLYANGENPGKALVAQYGAQPTGQTISLGTPQSPTPTNAPPPPINARPSPINLSPPRPPAPPSPPLPPNPVAQPVASLLQDGDLFGNQVPVDQAGRVAFQAVVLQSTVSTLNTAAGTNAITGVPAYINFNYTLVPVTAIGPNARRLQQNGNAPVTAPPGFVWHVEFQIVFNNVPVVILVTFTNSPNPLANSIAVSISSQLGFSGLIIAVQLNQVTITIINGAVIIIDITNPVPGYGNGFPGGGKRRLVERRAAGAASKALPFNSWVEAEPADIAYGTDKALFEIFTAPVDYYTAGAACAARGAKLASYKSEGAQVFIDILCDGASGSECWVEGNAAGACTAVGSSSVSQLSCSKRMPFICVKESGVATKASVVKESVEELAAAKPADVAFDSQHALYEVMPATVDYFTAGSVCLARGAQLANYESESAQVFIDVLCENATGQSCWVQGADDGKCSSVHLSQMQHSACSKRQAFVCTKPASKAVKA